MRRLVDILVATIVLVLLSPLLLLISLIVIVDSPGSPLYGGWRAGKGGREFRMWKFRTMVKNAGQIGGAITTPRDFRITRVGEFLRKSKLDELPQFFNLLLGDLTLVGPRPEDPGITKRYTTEQREVFRVKPGITGPTQLAYTTIEAETLPEGTNAQQYYVEHILDQKLHLDLDYLRQRTILSDLQVVSQTVLLVARALTQHQN
jgi:lipopolysaccharide/colanic/teichoic acid biosynthesis glycosyltransferase